MGSSRSKQSQNKLDSQRTQPFINSSSSSSYNLGQNKFYSNDISQSSNRKLQTNSPLKMPIQNTFQCDKCGMIFPSDEALYKHRTRFCLGVIDSDIRKKTYYSDDEDINESTRENNLTNRSRLRGVIKHQSPIEKKREEVNEWKTQRSILQSVQDMEDRILRDSKKTEKLANDLKKRTDDYNQLLSEYERLQVQERDLLRQVFNLQGQSGSHLNQSNGLNDYERNQLEILQRQNARLEQERRIIQNKLEELIDNNHQTSTIPNYEPYRLLRDMKEEQDRNEKALIYLRRRLIHPNSSLSTSSDIPSLPYVNPYRRTIGDDVQTLRNSYLQSGDYDSEVLPHSSDLERRLRQYEYYPWVKSFPEPLRHYRYHPIETATDSLMLAKNDNQRLQNELNHMERKFQRLDSRTRQLELTIATSGILDQKSNDYRTYPSSNIDRSYPSLNTDRYQSLKPLNNNTPARQTYTNYDNELIDQNQSYNRSSLPALDRSIPSRGTQPMNRVNSNISKLRDPLGPQPYDPIGGFVIFFDFIINLPSTIEQCRLITSLHHPQSGLGEPSSLQPSKCELYVDEKNGERMGIALIATKQPVPRCPPQQALTLVIEVQVTTKQTPNEILRTNSWTKLPLFDHRNRLLSGRWKVPLKSLPINQNESFAVINTLPSFGRVELNYRLVNFQDAAAQSTIPLSPTFRDLYFYPPQYRNGSYM